MCCSEPCQIFDQLLILEHFSCFGSDQHGSSAVNLHQQHSLQSCRIERPFSFHQEAFLIGLFWQRITLLSRRNRQNVKEKYRRGGKSEKWRSQDAFKDTYSLLLVIGLHDVYYVEYLLRCDPNLRIKQVKKMNEWISSENKWTEGILSFL